MPAEDLRGRLPLDGVRVLDLTDGAGAMSGRLLADLGADVVLVEPPGGARARSAPPLVDGVSLPFPHPEREQAQYARSTWSTPAGREEVLACACGRHPAREPNAWTADRGRSRAGSPARRQPATGDHVRHRLRARPGPYRDWVGTDWCCISRCPACCRARAARAGPHSCRRADSPPSMAQRKPPGPLSLPTGGRSRPGRASTSTFRCSRRRC